MLRNILLKEKKNKSLLLVWITLTSTFPFIVYTWPYHPYKILTFVCLCVMSFLIIRRKKIELSKNLVIVIAVQITFFFTIALLFSEYRLLNNIVQLFSCIIVLIYINGFIGFENFAKSYIKVMVYMGIGGVLALFIHVLIGINPLLIVKYSATGTTYFLGLTTTNDYYNLEGLRFIRFAGFFDEPGAFALFAFFALLINKLYFNNRKHEFLLIFTTVFTFSMAFYIIVFVYFILFYLKKTYIKRWLFILSFLFILFSFFSNYTGNDDFLLAIKTNTFERFEGDGSGDFKGNNRAAAMKGDKVTFLENPCWGVVDVKKVQGSNIYSVLASFGIFGSIFYYFLLIYGIALIFLITDKAGFWIALKIMILIVLNFFHRPEFASSFIFIVVYIIVYKFEQMTIYKCKKLT